MSGIPLIRGVNEFFRWCLLNVSSLRACLLLATDLCRDLVDAADEDGKLPLLNHPDKASLVDVSQTS